MKKAMLTTTVLLGTLLSGAGVAAAAPPFAGPSDIVAPTATPPEPEPCEVEYVTCDITLPTLEELPTDVANPTTTTDPTDPAGPGGPTDVANPTGDPDPTDPPETGEPVTTTTGQPPVERQENPPSGVPTPNRIDTGAGPGDPVSWWLIALPVLALLGLAATGAWLVIQRSERRPS